MYLLQKLVLILSLFCPPIVLRSRRGHQWGVGGCTLCAGKVTNQDQPHEIITEDLILLTGLTRKGTVSRSRRPAPSHVACQGRTETQTRTPDSKASSLSTTLHCLWAWAFPGPTGFQISKIKQEFRFQISTPWLTLPLFPFLGAWDCGLPEDSTQTGALVDVGPLLRVPSVKRTEWLPQRPQCPFM